MRLKTASWLVPAAALLAGAGPPAAAPPGEGAVVQAAGEAVPAPGKESPAPGKVAEAARRDRLVELLRPLLPARRRGAFYLAGARDDFSGEFRQGSSFYYLTGLDVPSAAMAILFDGQSSTERIYLQPVEDRWERYIGDVIEPGAVDGRTGRPDADRRRALRETGFRGGGGGDPRAVRPLEHALGDLREWLGRKGTLFLGDFSAGEGKPAPEEGTVPGDLLRRRRRIRVHSADPALARLRLVKSPEEVERIRKAVSITCAAHREAMAALRPGVPEYAIEGVIEHAFIRQGARYSAFPSIVGSGPHSTVLHYYLNGRRIGENELVVVDIGAEYERYASDVTRTLPSSGAYTPGQREIHDLVLRAQQEAMREAVPGSSIARIDARAREVIEQEGLLDAYWHSCCHYVGLDVHDVGERDAKLLPGMVLTVEPGIYLPEREIGVRIEDTVLITEEGHEVLSACVPAEAGEIEALMAGPGISPGAPASPPR